jgi:adenylate cyclase, class 2
MRYEVEMKFSLSDLSALESRLGELGATPSAPAAEVDVYFAHPARDFAQTDEALRIRRRAEGNWLTYKGPKIDATTKTRREIDLPLPSGDAAAEAWTELLKALGFVTVGEVRKLRRKAKIAWQGRNVEISLDEVVRLGPFIEIELIAEAGDVEAAKKTLAALAEQLGLEHSERRSYLELLADRGKKE